MTLEEIQGTAFKRWCEAQTLDAVAEHLIVCLSIAGYHQENIVWDILKAFEDVAREPSMPRLKLDVMLEQAARWLHTKAAE